MSFGGFNIGGLNPGNFNPSISIEAGDGDGPTFNISLFGGADEAKRAEAEKECGCGAKSDADSFLDDVKSVRSSAAKRALIDAFVEDALKGGGEEPAGEATLERAAADELVRPSEVTRPDAPQAKADKKDLPFKPLLKELQGIAEAIDKSKLPERTQGQLLDGIADLMGKLQEVRENGGNLREAALKGVADLVQTLDDASGREKAKGEIMNKLADTLVGIAKGKLGRENGEHDGARAPNAEFSAPETAIERDRLESSENQDVWTHEMKDGKAEVRLGDKYTLTAEEDGAVWTVKNNETGATTRVHGDPHVDVGSDGKNDWDFKEDMTFELDDGTKITVGTVDSGNGMTLSSSLTITNGDNAIQVTGLGANKDGQGNLRVVQSNAGETLDQLTRDGFTIEEEGDDWAGRNGGAIDQAAINAAEAAT